MRIVKQPVVATNARANIRAHLPGIINACDACVVSVLYMWCVVCAMYRAPGKVAQQDLSACAAWRASELLKRKGNEKDGPIIKGGCELSEGIEQQ